MKKLNLSLLFLMLLAVTGCSKSGEADHGSNGGPDPEPDPHGEVFYAGASQRSITPTQSEIVGIRNVISHTYDSLYVKSLLLDDGETKLLFVLVDVNGIDDYLVRLIKERIHERTGIPSEHVNISVTHTHHGLSVRRIGRYNVGPYADWPLDSYQRHVVEQSAAGAEEALANLKPAQIGWGKVDVPAHAHNRRFSMKSKTWKTPWGELEDVRTNPPTRNPDIDEPLGPSDPEVSFISVQTMEGESMALLANYSSHYPVDLPAPYLSADYYGVFAERIQELLNPGDLTAPFVGMMTMGTGGDQNTYDRRESSPPGTVFQRLERMGYDLARAVHGVYNAIEHKPWVKLGVEQSNLTLDVRKPTTEELEYGDFLLERRRQGLPFLNHSLETSYANHINRINDFWPDRVEVSLHAFRIGDLAVAAIPFEVFVETGLAIKEESPFSSTFTIGLSNGSFGYLPTERQHDFKGYETWIGLSSRVEKTAATKIQAEVLSLLSALREE